MKKFLLIALTLGALSCGAAGAAVTDVASNGFTIKLEQEIAAPPDKVYAALIEPARWWSSDHTFSGSAADLSLDPRAGGCFCETLPSGGSVQHLTVVYAVPGKLLRLVGMLGPFQSIAGNGVLTWTLKPVTAGTHLEMTYQIAGSANMTVNGKGYDFWSNAADGMLSAQVVRLARAIETGKAE
jgi:uncharacterized protein YndB with AHSA1/START domain